MKQLRGRSAEVTLFIDKLNDGVRATLLAAKVEIDRGAVALVDAGRQLEAVEPVGSRRVACDVLLMYPPHKQAELVRAKYRLAVRDL